MRELFAVGPHHVQYLDNGAVLTISGLEPASTTSIDGLEATTLEDPGPLRSSLVTMNDVHFGETECGRIDGVVAAAFVAEEGERPYPDVMNEAVVADAIALDPDAVIVRGDLTSNGTEQEYATFLQFYGVFGDRLTHVRGNHDSYHGGTFASWPVQVVDVPGLRVVLLDTSRPARSDGSISPEQCALVDEAARATAETVVVMGHHPLFVPRRDRSQRFDGVNEPDSYALYEVLARHDNVVAYSAGHNHRCRRSDLGGLAVIEVACTKDFPGAFGQLLVGEHGISHIVRRATAPAAVAWAEKTRSMFDGFYGEYAQGLLADRCFTLPLARQSPLEI